jgi:hypothetical protein
MPTRPWRAFWLCLAASVLLHFVLAAELPGFALRLEPAPDPLDAAIVVSEPPAPQALPKPPPPPAPPARQASVRPQPAVPAPQPAAEPTVAPALPAEDTIALGTEEPVAEPAPEIAAAEPQQDPPVQDSSPAPAEPAATAAAEPPAEPPAPEVGTISYEVYYGSDRLSIGRSVQTWSITRESYRLTSFAETTGLLGFFRPYLYSYVAEGRVQDGRLRPESFTVRRGRQGERQATASFDWMNRQLTFGTMGKPRKAALDGSSYDLLTLFYQLPHMELSPGSLNVAVTTGTKFDRYVLRVEAEELVELPIGTVRAIPVKQVRTPGKESIEVWLAPDQRYLPVRIRFYDDDGDVAVEQVATQIAVGTLAADGR